MKVVWFFTVWIKRYNWFPAGHAKEYVYRISLRYKCTQGASLEMAALKGVCDLNRQKHILRNLTKVDRMLTQTTEPSWL